MRYHITKVCTNLSLGADGIMEALNPRTWPLPGPEYGYTDDLSYRIMKALTESRSCTVTITTCYISSPVHYRCHWHFNLIITPTADYVISLLSALVEKSMETINYSISTNQNTAFPTRPFFIFHNCLHSGVRDYYGATGLCKYQQGIGLWYTHVQQDTTVNVRIGSLNTSIKVIPCIIVCFIELASPSWCVNIHTF